MRNEGLGSWPARRARITPARTAFVSADADVTVTFGDLDARVNRLARVLHDLGVSAGDRIAYLGPNHPALLETLFAAGAVGGIFVPLNTRLAPPEIAYMLDDCGAAVLVWDAALADIVAEIGDTPAIRIRVGEGADGSDYEELLAAASPAPFEDVPVGLDDVCMIMYTSGTTGRPKGAMLTHGNLTWNCFNLLLDLDIVGDDVALISAPLFHTAALNHTALPVFLKGGSSVLAARFSPEASFDLIATHGITLMFGVPAMFQQITASPRWSTTDLSSLRILHCGGAPVPEVLIRRYQERGLTFVQGYGMTEASPGIMVLRPEDSVRKISSAGRPHFFTDIRVVGRNFESIPVGEPGEIVARGPNVMLGYWQRPEATAQTLAHGWLHTGDVATVDADGYVFIVDRVKDMIISGGENIYPAEVESVLYQHPAVAECAVIGVPDEKWGEVGRAVVVLREEAVAVDPQDILDYLGGRLAKYKIPRSIVAVGDLPRNASGKLLRVDVRQTHGAP